MTGGQQADEVAAASTGFDMCGPLPQGTTLLEASAGTGKTYTIAALATRYVAEGHAELHQIMLVTFGRAATQELRERVRDRFVVAERALRDPTAARSEPDPLVRLLADADDEQVALRRSRLATALAAFDSATIATTHGFCHQMLTGLGISGDLDMDAVFVESTADRVRQVTDDLYLGRYARPGEAEPACSPADAHRIVRDAVADPLATLAPADADPGTGPGQRYRLATAARKEVERRKRAGHLLDYDDLVLLLRAALADPEWGPAACQRVRSRYSVVLVDEFQDTDGAQWDVLLAAFHGSTTLVLIGDPKQAVYAFRGGDVTTYLAAAGVTTARETLRTNWRSDAALVAALDKVYGATALGDAHIRVLPVVAAHQGSRLPPGTPPLRLRVLRRDQCGALDNRGLPAVSAVRATVAADLAADVVHLLAAGTSPRDVAVLVHTNSQGATIREHLVAAGVPVVLAGSTSVFGTPGARDWLVLLQALEQPHRSPRLRAAALTDIVGWSARELDELGEVALDRLGPQLRRWAAVLAERGVAALFELASAGLAERLLALPDGERRLTDLRHVAQSLHIVGTREGAGPTALVEWLSRRTAEVGIEGVQERSRRLESDAEAVQVVTVHRSKGLEFPVVYVPFGWDRHQDPRLQTLLLHDGSGSRILDVGGPGDPGYSTRRKVHDLEAAGEDLRLFYVAMTRASSQVVTWWAPSRNTPAAALHRLLLGGRDADGSPPLTVPVPTDQVAATRLGAYAETGLLAVEPVPSPGLTIARWAPPPAPGVPLAAARFDRDLDTAWRRTSYSALTAAAHEAGSGLGAAGPAAGAATEPEHAELPDEPGPTFAGPTGSAQPGEGDITEPLGPDLPMAALPSGPAFGTLVHEVLETVDTGASDLSAELTARCTSAVSGRLGPLDPVTLAAALLPVLQTPLGPLAGDLRLCDIAPVDRLAELDFEVPLAGGDAPGGRNARGAPVLTDLAPLLRRHLPDNDPLTRYPDLLETLEPQQLRGYLTGSIDALLRVDGRFLVVDYKTNRLAADPLTSWHYRPAALADAMLAAHYPLQALLYCVAAHRFLRWRLPAYDIDRHLGGVLYLFVRGMAGPATPVSNGTPYGVFAWRPPSALVTELSDLLAGRP